MKSKAAFLSAHNGNHEAALDAVFDAYAASQNALSEAQEQAQSGAGESIRTRVIAKSLIPLAEALGIELPEPNKKPAQNAEQVISEQVTAALESLEELEGARDMALELLGEAGLDLEALEDAEDDDQLNAVVGEWLGSIDTLLDSAETLPSQLAAYQYAHEKGLDPEAVLKVRGIEGLRQRETEREEDGKKVKVKEWAVGDADDAPLADDFLKPVMGGLTAAQQSNWTVQQDTHTQARPATSKELDTQRQSSGAYNL